MKVKAVALNPMNDITLKLLRGGVMLRGGNSERKEN